MSIKDSMTPPIIRLKIVKVEFENKILNSLPFGKNGELEYDFKTSVLSNSVKNIHWFVCLLCHNSFLFYSVKHN